MRDTQALNLWVFSQFAHALGTEILEVGCGNGNFTALLGGSGARVLGIDIDPAFVGEARAATAHLDNVTIEHADITKHHQDKRFDTVVMLDVLEHIEDDIALLANLKERIKPGGSLIVKTPAMPSLYGSLDKAVGHFRRYSRRDLSSRLLRAGFDRIDVHAFNAAGVLGWWINGSLLGRTVPPAGQLKSFNRLVPVFRRLDRLVPAGIGLSLVGIARRKTDDLEFRANAHPRS